MAGSARYYTRGPPRGNQKKPGEATPTVRLSPGFSLLAPVAKLETAAGLGPAGEKSLSGFESRRGHFQCKLSCLSAKGLWSLCSYS